MESLYPVSHVAVVKDNVVVAVYDVGTTPLDRLTPVERVKELTASKGIKGEVLDVTSYSGEIREGFVKVGTSFRTPVIEKASLNDIMAYSHQGE